MRHRHSGPAVRYRTIKGNIRYRKRPMHNLTIKKEGRRGSRRFTQSLFHAGNEPPSEKIKRGEPVFGFSSPEFAEAWAEKHGYDDVYQFQTSDYDLDKKQYMRNRGGEKVISDNEYIAMNVLREEDIEDEDNDEDE